MSSTVHYIVVNDSYKKTSNRALEGKQINKHSENFVCIVTLFPSQNNTQNKTGRTKDHILYADKR